MANPSPLQSRHEAHDAQMMAFGDGVDIAAVFDVVETEYGRLRNRAAVMDGAHRALIELSGGDRLDFLHRLLTNDCAPASARPGEVRRQFMLDRQGKIMADMLQVETDGRTWLDTDVHSADTIIRELDLMRFGEDVEVRDVTAQRHRLSLHGPAAAELAHPHEHEAVVFRHDECDVPGWHVWMPSERADGAWAAWTVGDDPPAKALGWLAYNMARIEAGTPLYRVDFGPDTIPNETGLMARAVSNTKGCFRGQEIVARIRDRGHPARTLVRFAGETDALPVAGEQVHAEPSHGKPVGAITSSAPSPLRGGKPIGLAMVKWNHHEPGTRLYSPAEGATVPIVIEPLASA